MEYYRSNMWTADDDLILAETTLRHIREGEPLKKAYERASELLARTPDACATRWKSYLKHKYDAAISIAKASWERKKRQALKG